MIRLNEKVGTVEIIEFSILKYSSKTKILVLCNVYNNYMHITMLSSNKIEIDCVK